MTALVYTLDIRRQTTRRMDVSVKADSNLVKNEVAHAGLSNGYGAFVIANNAVGALTSGGENLKKSTLSWRGINVFAPVDGGGCCRSTCCKGEIEEIEPSIKQILFDGKLLLTYEKSFKQ